MFNSVIFYFINCAKVFVWWGGGKSIKFEVRKVRKETVIV